MFIFCRKYILKQSRKYNKKQTIFLNHSNTGNRIWRDNKSDENARRIKAANYWVEFYISLEEYTDQYMQHVDKIHVVCM